MEKFARASEDAKVASGHPQRPHSTMDPDYGQEVTLAHQRGYPLLADENCQTCPNRPETVRIDAESFKTREKHLPADSLVPGAAHEPVPALFPLQQGEKCENVQIGKESLGNASNHTETSKIELKRAKERPNAAQWPFWSFSCNGHYGGVVKYWSNRGKPYTKMTSRTRRVRIHRRRGHRTRLERVQKLAQ